MLAARAVWAQADATAGPVEVKVLSVGVAGNVAPARWTGILLEMRSASEKPVGLTIESQSTDIDGDRATIRRKLVLAPATPQRLWIDRLCEIDRETGKPLLNLTIKTDNGRSCKLNAGSKAVAIDDRETLMVIVSRYPVEGLAELMKLKNDKPLRINRLSPELWRRVCPNRARLLEPMATLIWVDPLVDRFTPEQIEAVMDWTRRGGRLILAVAGNWQGVARSDLAKLLPVRLRGFGQFVHQGKLTRCCLAELRSGRAIRIEQGPPKTVLIARRPYGRGTAAFLGFDPHSKYRPSLKLKSVWRTLIPPEETGEASGTDIVEAFQLVPLTAPMQAGLVSLAVLTMIVYAALAGPGSFFLLRRKQKTQYSWVVFGLAAVGFSLLTLLLVWMVRGSGSDLWRLSVIDMTTGRKACVGRTYGGLTLTNHRKVNIALTDDGGLMGGAILPRPPSGSWTDAPFPDPRTYTLNPVEAQMTNVPIRATLKQFTCDWRSEMPGTIQGKITQTDPLAGTIENKLGVDLEQAVLFIPDGRTSFRVLNLGDLPTGTVMPLDDKDPISPKAFYDSILKDWLKKPFFYGGKPIEIKADDQYRCGLIATTFRYYQAVHRQEKITQEKPQLPDLTCANVGRFDLSDALRDGLAVLCGISSEPAAAPLDLQIAGLKPTIKSLTLYRVLIPVKGTRP